MGGEQTEGDLLNSEAYEEDLWEEGWEEAEDLQPGREFKWDADAVEIGERVDRFVTDRMPQISRTQAQKWIEQGCVQVSSHSVKPNYKLRSGDCVELIVPAQEGSELVPEELPLDILYEDADVLVVNKTRGMVVHPAAGNPSGTLVNALLHHCDSLSTGSAQQRPGIVHRIDKDTSGLLMVAKNDMAHRKLSEQLSEHTVTRRYLGIAHGVLQHDVGTIDAPIGRHPVQRQKMAPVKSGRHAVTHFTVLERFANYTYVECRLETGRTHQIRVHFEFIGHPLAGDPLYGRKKTLPIKGQALHAETLGFVHPRTGEYLEFHAPIPADMEKLLEMLRTGSF